MRKADAEIAELDKLIDMAREVSVMIHNYTEKSENYNANFKGTA